MGRVQDRVVCVLVLWLAQKNDFSRPWEVVDPRWRGNFKKQINFEH